MTERLTAVIPTFNAEAYVINTVKALLEYQDFDEIIVCDDASTDGTVERAGSIQDDRVRVIAGETNLGAGSNRHRALEYLPDDGNTLFVDVDTEVLPDVDFRRLVTEGLADPTVGAVGFSIVSKDSKPMIWNFGTLMHPSDEARDWSYKEMFDAGEIDKDTFIQRAPKLAASLRIYELNEPTQVGWVAEGCYAARNALLRKIGNYGATIRYHEAHFLGKSIVDLGYKVIFDSRRHVMRHLEHNVTGDRRRNDDYNARLQYYAKYWDMSEKTFQELFHITPDECETR